MNLLDFVLAIIVGLSIAAGIKAGFARVGIGFIATICGLIFGWWYGNVPGVWIREHWTMSVNMSNLLGFFAVFFLCLMAGGLVGLLLAKLFKWTGLTWLDRLLGGVFGLLRGALFAVIFVAVAMAFTPKPLPAWMVDSQALPYVVDASDMASRLAPEAVKNAFRDSLFEIRKLWQEQVEKNRKKIQEKAKKADS